jgi:hypothetical protein
MESYEQCGQGQSYCSLCTLDTIQTFFCNKLSAVFLTHRTQKKSTYEVENPRPAQQILLLDFDNLNLPFQKIIPAMFGPILLKF